MSGGVCAGYPREASPWATPGTDTPSANSMSLADVWNLTISLYTTCSLEHNEDIVLVGKMGQLLSPHLPFPFFSCQPLTG